MNWCRSGERILICRAADLAAAGSETDKPRLPGHAAQHLRGAFFFPLWQVYPMICVYPAGCTDFSAAG